MDLQDVVFDLLWIPADKPFNGYYPQQDPVGLKQPFTDRYLL
jgi:hypothetical protein